jgi:hypothetical protein
MLVLDPSEVAVTDTADHAVAALADAAIREVVLVGRRGLAQAAFTPARVLAGGPRRTPAARDPQLLRSPIEILGTDRVEGIRLAINAIVQDDEGNLKGCHRRCGDDRRAGRAKYVEVATDRQVSPDSEAAERPGA